MPLLAAHLTRKEIRSITNGEGDSVLYVHRAMIGGCDGAIRSAADLDSARCFDWVCRRCNYSNASIGRLVSEKIN